MSGLEGAIHRIRIDRLNADHANLRHDGFHISSDAGNKPAASDGHEDGCQVARMLPHDFVRDRALTGNHQRIIKRMHEREPTVLCKVITMKLRLRIVIAHKDNLRIERLDRFHFDIRCGFGHHDNGVYS